jgi:catecholate siderophore receptor
VTSSAFDSFVRVFTTPLVAFLLSASSSTGQTPLTLPVNGTVLDASGGAVPAVAIDVVDATGRVQRTTTDAVGRFAVSVYGPGPYTIVAAIQGFAPGIVTANAEQQVTITLVAARLEEQVTVTSPARRESTVSSATKTSTPLLLVPQTIEVVDQTLLRAQAATSMQDAMRNVAGVNSNLGEGRRDQFLIRGFNAQNDTLVDGVRDDALYYRDLATIDRIEVLKGPAAALFGRGSSGGVINRILKTPLVGSSVTDIAVTAGSLGARRISADVGQPLGSDRLAFRLVAAGEDSRSYRDFFFLRRATFAPSLLWSTGSTRVLGQFEYLHDRRRPDRGIPSVDGRPADVSVGQYYGYPEDDVLETTVAAATLRAERRFGSGLLRNVFRTASSDSPFSNTSPSGVRTTAQGLRVLRTQYNVDSSQQNRFNQTEALLARRFAGATHALLAGIEIGFQSREQRRFTGTAPDVALFEPVLTAPQYATTPTTDNQFDGRTTAVYAQDQLAIGQRWHALIGVRGDRYVQRLDDRSLPNVDLRRVDVNWSPRAGLVFQPTRATSIYTSVSRSFQPSGEGLSLAVNAAELKPEISRNLEVGAKADLFGGRVTATAAVFRLDRTNIKTTDPIDPTRLVLVGRQRTDGVELAFDGRVTDRLTAHAGYAWLGASVLQSNTVSSGVRIEGNRPGLVPAHSANAWASFAATDRWTLGGGITPTGDRFTSNDNLVTLPAYLRADAMTSYAVRNWEVALNVHNLLNARYYETAGSNFQIYPGTPRELLLTLRVSP